MITFDEWRKKVSEEVEKNAEDLKGYLDEVKKNGYKRTGRYCI